MKTIAMLAALALTAALSMVGQAQECADDTDCEEGYSCQVTAASSPGCDPGADGGCPNPEITEYRECEPKPLTCATDAECPHGLTCVTEDSDDCTVTAPEPGGGEGQAVCEEPTGEKVCALVLVECENNGDCAANQECVPTQEEICSSPPPCSGEGECNDEPICEPDPSAYICFPKQVACSTATDCGKGQVCYDLGERVEELPPWWQPGQGSEFCFSEGFALVLDERVEVIADFLEARSDNSAAESGSGSRSSDADAERAGGASDESSAGGCLIAGTTPSGAAGSLTILLLGLVAAARRWRR